MAQISGTLAILSAHTDRELNVTYFLSDKISMESVSYRGRANIYGKTHRQFRKEWIEEMRRYGREAVMKYGQTYVNDILRIRFIGNHKISNHWSWKLHNRTLSRLA